MPSYGQFIPISDDVSFVSKDKLSVKKAKECNVPIMTMLGIQRKEITMPLIVSRNQILIQISVCFCKKLNQKRNKVLHKGNCVAEICCCSPQIVYEICSTMFKSSRMKSNHMHRSFNKSKGIDTGSNEECLLMLKCALLRFGRLVQQHVAMMCRIKKRIF